MEMSNIVIRPVKREDQTKVKTFFEHLGPEGTFFFNRRGGNCNRALTAAAGEIPYYHAFMAEAEGAMVGYVFLYDMDKCVPVLGIGALEGYKGIGVGSAMMSFAIEYAKKMGKGGIMLTTHVANIRGQALYEKYAFERLGTALTGEFLYLLRFDAE